MSPFVSDSERISPILHGMRPYRPYLRVPFLAALAVVSLLVLPQRAAAQDNPTGDPVVQRIYEEGMRRSQAARLAQVLMDSIGPRLTGSPANRAANDWLLRPYQAGGGDGENEQHSNRSHVSG